MKCQRQFSGKNKKNIISVYLMNERHFLKKRQSVKKVLTTLYSSIDVVYAISILSYHLSIFY